jgi:hypothetical protein
MRDSAEIWNLHLVYRLTHSPEGFDDDVRDNVRTLVGVTSVAVAVSPDTSTHLAFSTPYANAISGAVAATQCLHEAIDAHNATGRWWQREVRLVDEPAVRKVA